MATIKRFIHFQTKAAFTAASKGTDYNDQSIVFIKDTQEIWTHGQFYSIPDAYVTKITNLETAVEALQKAQAADYAFRKVTDGTNTFSASNGKETLNLKGGSNTSVSVNAETGEVTIASTINTAQFYPADSGSELEGRVEDLEDASFTIQGSDGVTVEGTETKTVGLKLDSTGNVTLSKSSAGLKANIDVDTLVPVTGVASGDKVLKLTDKKISSTLKLDYDTTGKKIQIKGIDDAVVTELDAERFIKDGMLSNVEYDEETHKLSFTFNTDAGEQTIDDIDLSDLIDTYDGSNLKLKSIEIPSGNAKEPTATDSVDSAVANLIKKDRELAAKIESIESDLEDVVSDGLTEIEKGPENQFVTVTVSEKADNKQSVSVAVKTDVAIADATNTSNGLATAYAVKTYVEEMLSWEEKD